MCYEINVRMPFPRQNSLALDWNKHKPHRAGSVCTPLLQYMLENQCIRPLKNSKAMIFTGTGLEIFLKIWNENLN